MAYTGFFSNAVTGEQDTAEAYDESPKCSSHFPIARITLPPVCPYDRSR